METRTDHDEGSLASAFTDGLDARHSYRLHLDWLGKGKVDMGDLVTWCSSTRTRLLLSASGAHDARLVRSRMRRQLARWTQDLPDQMDRIESTIEDFIAHRRELDEAGLPTKPVEADSMDLPGKGTGDARHIGSSARVTPKEIEKYLTDLRHKEIIEKARDRLEAAKTEHAEALKAYQKAIASVQAKSPDERDSDTSLKKAEQVFLDKERRYHAKVMKYHLRLSALEATMVERFKVIQERLAKKNHLLLQTFTVITAAELQAELEDTPYQVSEQRVVVQMSLRSHESVELSMEEQWNHLDKHIAAARVDLTPFRDEVVARIRAFLKEVAQARTPPEPERLAYGGDEPDDIIEPDMEAFYAQSEADVEAAERSFHDDLDEILLRALSSAEDQVEDLLRGSYAVGRLSRLLKKRRLVRAAKGSASTGFAVTRLVITGGADLTAYFTLAKQTISALDELRRACQSLDTVHDIVASDEQMLLATLAEAGEKARELSKASRKKAILDLITDQLGILSSLDGSLNSTRDHLERYAARIHKARLQLIAHAKLIEPSYSKLAGSLDDFSRDVRTSPAEERVESVDGLFRSLFETISISHKRYTEDAVAIFDGYQKLFADALLRLRETSLEVARYRRTLNFFSKKLYKGLETSDVQALSFEGATLTAASTTWTVFTVKHMAKHDGQTLSTTLQKRWLSTSTDSTSTTMWGWLEQLFDWSASL